MTVALAIEASQPNGIQCRVGCGWDFHSWASWIAALGAVVLAEGVRDGRPFLFIATIERLMGQKPQKCVLVLGLQIRCSTN